MFRSHSQTEITIVLDDIFGPALNVSPTLSAGYGRYTMIGENGLKSLGSAFRPGRNDDRACRVGAEC